MAACSPPSLPGHVDRLRSLAINVDEARLLLLADRHRIAGFVQRAIKAGGCSLTGETAKRLAAAARIARIKSIGNAAEEARIANAAAASQVDVLFLKGATLAVLAHDDPGIKVSWDIDLAIDACALPQARRLLTGLGYRLATPFELPPGPRLERWFRREHETAWHNAERGTVVELHTRLSAMPSLLPNVGPGSPRNVPLVAGARVPTLADPDLFAYLSVHGTVHRWRRLKWLADLAGLVTQSVVPTGTLLTEARRRGAGRCGDVALLLASELLHLPLPEPLAAEMMEDDRTCQLVSASMKAIQRAGDDVEPVAATMRQMGRDLIDQLRMADGPAHKLQTLDAQWKRSRRASSLFVPDKLVSVAHLGLVPFWLLARAWRRQVR